MSATNYSEVPVPFRIWCSRW